MQSAIDVRDMHTAIHNLYIVKRKPKTTLKLFKALEGCCCEYESEPIWEEINKNTEYFGEYNINLHPIGDRFWRDGDLISQNHYDDGENKFHIIGSFDI